MWMLSLALAGDFGRQTESLRQTRYSRLRGDGPVFGRWRNRRGAFLATRFADGQIEHVDIYDGRELKETRLFAADGRAHAHIDWGASVVHFPWNPVRSVEFGTWKEQTLAGVMFRVPERVATQEQPAADPFDPTFGTELEGACGCEIDARTTVWIAGHPAAHFRLHRTREEADLYAWPIDDALWVFSATASDLDGLLPIRAMMATARKAP